MILLSITLTFRRRDGRHSLITAKTQRCDSQPYNFPAPATATGSQSDWACADWCPADFLPVIGAGWTADGGRERQIIGSKWLPNSDAAAGWLALLLDTSTPDTQIIVMHRRQSTLPPTRWSAERKTAAGEGRFDRKISIIYRLYRLVDCVEFYFRHEMFSNVLVFIYFWRKTWF